MDYFQDKNVLAYTQVGYVEGKTQTHSNLSLIYQLESQQTRHSDLLMQTHSKGSVPLASTQEEVG